MRFDLRKYYEIIRSKIENDNFEIGFFNVNLIQDESSLKKQCKANSHLESIHYLMYEFWLDRKDPRINSVFDYICMPSGVNEEELNIDFRQWTVEVFLEEIMKLKD